MELIVQHSAVSQKLISSLKTHVETSFKELNCIKARLSLPNCMWQPAEILGQAEELAKVVFMSVFAAEMPLSAAFDGLANHFQMTWMLSAHSEARFDETQLSASQQKKTKKIKLLRHR